MKDKIIYLLIALSIYPALLSAAPKEEKVFAGYFDIPINSPEGTEVIGRIHLERNKDVLQPPFLPVTILRFSSKRTDCSIWTPDTTYPNELWEC